MLVCLLIGVSGSPLSVQCEEFCAPVVISFPSRRPVQKSHPLFFVEWHCRGKPVVISRPNTDTLYYAPRHLMHSMLLSTNKQLAQGCICS